MEEKKTVKVKLEKHLWPDEIEKRKKKRNKRLVKWIVVAAIVVSFAVGYNLGGSSKKETMVSSVTTSQDSFSYNKLKLINRILTTEWYFGEDSDDFSESLVEKAISGMVNNETDIHTSYMTKEEAESFTSGIDMGFVGIGVQFTTADNLNMITRVFSGSPAEKAGVKPGDIIYKVNGVVVEEFGSDKIAEMVKGEEGTQVTITILRRIDDSEEEIDLDITRGKVENSAYGEMVEDNIGYLEIYQFGSSTAATIKAYLDDLSAQGMEKLIIDLRDNGGGYLLALVDIASFFLPADTVCIQQEYRDKTVEVSKTKGGNYENINEIVILINGNTASASEVLAAALKEQRDDVTIVGTTSYGKGTAQVSRPFSDGTTLKYTTSRWLTPSGNWIDKTGITPDEEVYLHEILYNVVYAMEEGASYSTDEVSEYVRIAQLALDFLGYDLSRTDGYFDLSTKNALIAYQQKYDLDDSGVLDEETYESLISSVSREWSLYKDSLDSQFIRAVEILKSSEVSAVHYSNITALGNEADLSYAWALEESLIRKDSFGI